jgi:ribosomal subunit interface protein
MQRDLQITFRDMEPSDAVEDHLREKMAWLEKFHSGIVGAKIVVEAPHQHNHQGQIYEVHLEIDVPGNNIHVSHAHEKNHAHEDVYVAIRDAFKAARRQLEAHNDKMHRKEKRHAS